MKAVHEAGFRGIAPYMRGYGEPDASARLTDVAEFNVYRLAGDMLALLQDIGTEKAALSAALEKDLDAVRTEHIAWLREGACVKSVTRFPSASRTAH